MMPMKRRTFLRNVSIAGGGVVLGVTLGGCGGETIPWPNVAWMMFAPDARKAATSRSVPAPVTPP